MIFQYGKLIINLAEQPLSQPTKLLRRFQNLCRLADFFNYIKIFRCGPPGGRSARWPAVGQKRSNAFVVQSLSDEKPRRSSGAWLR